MEFVEDAVEPEGKIGESIHRVCLLAVRGNGADYTPVWDELEPFRH